MFAYTFYLLGDDIKQITEKAKEGHYQVACQYHFNVSHPLHNHVESVSSHPNSWFNASVNYYKSKNSSSSKENR
ncbi:MAG: hypothetical protein JHC73_20225 [Dolichospermum sp.]|jgi:hypothetical protein|nr:hypothetical protein [Dolichospermum sp.]